MRVDVLARNAARARGDVVVQAFELPVRASALPFGRWLRSNADRLVTKEAGALTWMDGQGTAAPRVLMVCLGRRSEAGSVHGWSGSPQTMEQDDARRRLLRHLGSAIERACDAQLVEHVVLAPPPAGIDPVPVVEGMLQRAHGSTEFAPDWQPSSVRSVKVCVDDRAALAELQPRMAELCILMEAVALARTLGDLPANVGSPAEIVRRARAMAQAAGLRATVLGPATLRRLRMGLLLGVAGGGAPPAVLVLEHKPSGRGPFPEIVLLGKGLTHDTGGYNLKLTPDLHRFTDDKSGAVAVIGAMQAVARLQVPARVVGVAPLLENAVDAAAYKPGDILTAMNGTTVFVESTDAEGRLVLADCLTWIARRRPRAVIDIATLSGAAACGLGEPFGALYANDAGLRECLERAAMQTGELLWAMPIHPSHDAVLEHPRAMLRNLGSSVGAASSAAAFLRRFVAFPWAHIDMAGLGSVADAREGMGAGATGWGTRLLVAATRELATHLSNGGGSA